MRAAVEIEVDGRPVTLALPLGGLERIAEVNPAIEEVRDSFALRGPLGSRVWRLDELKAVLSAGLAYGGGATVAELIEALGLEGCRALALRLMNRAFAVEDGPPENPPTAASDTFSASATS